MEEKTYKKKNPKYDNPIYKEMRIVIKLRDEHTCNLCKNVKFNIEIHHVSKDTSDNSPSNLLSICDECHQLLHDKKMKFNFTELMKLKHDRKIENYYKILLLKYNKN
jgi:5-methylcytosine-specific restriction endonuclease McrA